MNQSDTGQGDVPKRKLSFWLIIGIFFVPYIFAWFLLRKGYSTLARIIGFAWMAAIIIAIAMPDKLPDKKPENSDPVVAEAKTGIDSAAVVELETEAPPEEPAEVPLEDLMPQKEKNLIEVLKKGWEKSEFSYTEAEKYKLMKERKASVSNGYQMTDWVGTVFDAQYHQESNEISLVIVLYQGNEMIETIQVGTGTSANPKYKAPTTIKEGTALFDKAINLNSDDKVRFSGTLYLKDYSPWSASRADDNPLDGFGQLSFLTKFSKLEKID